MTTRSYKVAVAFDDLQLQMVLRPFQRCTPCQKEDVGGLTSQQQEKQEIHCFLFAVTSRKVTDEDD